MKRIFAIICVFALLLGLIGCAKTEKPAESSVPTETELPTEPATEPSTEPSVEPIVVEPENGTSIYVLAGPTGIGAVNLWAENDARYSFTMAGANDEVVAAISQGTADIACVATNLAATLYNKTEGNVTVLAVNTLGVLSMLSRSELSSVEELRGKTIYSPGQGANPEYILRYVLSGNGIDPDNDVNIQFVGEGSELLTVWQTDPEAVLMAPQPVATAIALQNEDAKVVLDMTEEWNKIANGESTLMMGCVIVRNEFLAQYPAAVEQFLTDYEASIAKATEDIDGTAQLCEEYGLIAKAPMAKKAIPACNLCFITGSEMQQQLGGYLQVMFDANPKSVGGAMPEESFYYVR